ncbi:MAG TPA: antibiotic biosynthesis monooxygenase [Vicinamibacterales bacterium]|nr:antibiotic biosynthesis monooxygenase [Vicinamibacterales bacterium]
MIAVIFEVEMPDGHRPEYLSLAADLASDLARVEGFISIERFESITRPGKLLSLSFWQDEDAVRRWRGLESHRAAQRRGREHVFSDYRLRVATVVRDYGLTRRDEAPQDSRERHG